MSRLTYSIVLFCIALAHGAQAASLRSRHLLQTNSGSLASSTLEAARAAASGDASRAQAALDAARQAASRADDLVDDDDYREIANANALSAASGAATAAAAFAWGGNSSRSSEVNSSITAAQSLIDAVASARTGSVSDRVEDAADAASEAAEGAVSAAEAARAGTKDAISDAFSDADDVAEEADDARESGAGSASIYGAQTAAYIVLAGAHRYRNQTAESWNAALDAGLSAQRTATAAAATTDSSGGCDAGSVSQDADRLTDIVDLDDDDDDDDDDDSKNWEEALNQAVPLAQQIVQAAFTACPVSNSQTPVPATG